MRLASQQWNPRRRNAPCVSQGGHGGVDYGDRWYPHCIASRKANGSVRLWRSRRKECEGAQGERRFYSTVRTKDEAVGEIVPAVHAFWANEERAKKSIPVRIKPARGQHF